MTNTIQQYSFKDGLLQEFEIISLKNVMAEHGQMLSTPHRTDFYEIIWVEEGTLLMYIDFLPFTLKPYSLLFIGKDKVHFFDLSSNFKAKGLLFTDSFFGQSVNDLKYLQTTQLFNQISGVPTIEASSSTKVFPEIIIKMEEELNKEKDEYQDQILKNLLHNFLLAAEREKSQFQPMENHSGIDLDIYLVFRQVLETKFKENKSVSFYASSVNVSEKRLNRAITLISGKSPKQVIDERVVLESKRLLIHTSESVKEIAYKLGFEDPANFINYLKKHTGKAPLEFKQSYRF